MEKTLTFPSTPIDTAKTWRQLLWPFVVTALALVILSSSECDEKEEGPHKDLGKRPRSQITEPINQP